MDAGSTPFDLDPHALRCPYEHYEELREQGAVVPVEELGALAVLGMDDIRTVLRQPGAASSRTPTGPAVAAQIGAALTHLREAGRLPPTAIAYLDGRHDRTLFTIDPPNHTRQRRLMGRLFAPRQVDAWRSVVGPIADDVVSRLVACPGPVDLVTDFAVPIPVAVIATLLRMPVEDHERLKRWSVDVTRIIGNPQADDEAFARSVAARQEMAEYFGARLDQARDVPGDDLVTAVAEAGIEGEGAGLTESERCGLLINFLTAGNETTTKLLASGAWLLGERPDVLARLRAEPNLVPAFVEEVLRLEPPTQGMFREIVADIDLEDSDAARGHARLPRVRRRQPRPCRLRRPPHVPARSVQRASAPQLRPRHPPVPRCRPRPHGGAGGVDRAGRASERDPARRREHVRVRADLPAPRAALAARRADRGLMSERRVRRSTADCPTF